MFGKIAQMFKRKPRTLELKQAPSESAPQCIEFVEDGNGVVRYARIINLNTEQIRDELVQALMNDFKRFFSNFEAFRIEILTQSYSICKPLDLFSISMLIIMSNSGTETGIIPDGFSGTNLSDCIIEAFKRCLVNMTRVINQDNTNAENEDAESEERPADRYRQAI